MTALHYSPGAFTENFLSARIPFCLYSTYGGGGLFPGGYLPACSASTRLSPGGSLPRGTMGVLPNTWAPDTCDYCWETFPRGLRLYLIPPGFCTTLWGGGILSSAEPLHGVGWRPTALPMVYIFCPGTCRVPMPYADRLFLENLHIRWVEQQAPLHFLSRWACLPWEDGGTNLHC